MNNGIEPPGGTDGDERNNGVVVNPFNHLILPEEPEEEDNAAERQRIENEDAETARRERAAEVELQRIVDEETARNAEIARNVEMERDAETARLLALEGRHVENAPVTGVSWAPVLEDVNSTSTASENSQFDREWLDAERRGLETSQLDQARLKAEMEEEIKRRTKEDVDRIVAAFQQQHFARQPEQHFARQPEHDSFRLPSQHQSPVLREPLGVTGHSTQSGLTISSNVRSAKEQTQATIFPKEFRGQSDSERLKRKKMVTEKLDVELGVNSAISMLTETDSTNHDLATACQSSQVSLRAFFKRCKQHDMVSPFYIALNFDESNPTSANVGPYVNLLKDYEEVTLEKAKEWQRFLNKHAHAVEHESLQWAMDLMEKSMSTELKELVHDDYEQAVEDELSRGTITLFKIMTDRMVLSNQETIDAMCNYLAAFDIRNTNGQNVVVAARKIKAIIRALGPKRLPSNVMVKILTGFGHADNEVFKEQCTMLATMNRSTIAQGTLANMSTMEKCYAVMRDLETTYLSHVASHSWGSTGHNKTAFNAAALNALDDPYETAMAALAHGQPRLPREEWLKLQTCHNCQKMGHLSRDCPSKKNDSRRASENQNLSI